MPILGGTGPQFLLPWEPQARPAQIPGDSGLGRSGILGPQLQEVLNPEKLCADTWSALTHVSGPRAQEWNSLDSNVGASKAGCQGFLLFPTLSA